MLSPRRGALRALFLTSQSALSHTAVRDGIDRAEAAKIGGMDRQTLRDWVHRFKPKGLDGSH